MPRSLLPPREASPAANERPPLDLLDAEEVSRARMFALVAVAIASSILLLLPFLGGDRSARTMLGAGLLLAVLASAWFLWSLRRVEQYDVTHLAVAGVAWLLAELAGLHYFGPLSPMVVPLPLGVFFFGSTRDSRVQVVAYVAAAAAYLAVAVASFRGASPARASLSTAQSMTMLALTEVVLFVTFLSARMVCATSVLALARAERAASLLLQRDALLAEVQKDLARALDVAGVGRFSETVVGNYALGAVIGRGAMGEVYAAVHKETHAEAAVKLLHAHTLREPESVRRFLREAKMASALETPHAVRILEVGGFDGDLPYLAMERLRGEDLAEVLRRSPTLSVPELLRLLSEIGEGLSSSRAAGVVHRDVKPRNIFRATTKTGETVWKLLDFGVSKLASADATHADGRIIGTPEYMAPEQAAGEPVTHRTDLFSLGAVVYRALTGCQAFAGDHIAEVLYQVAHSMPPRPSSLADVTPQVDLVLAVALAKSPSLRFDSAEELRDALEAATRGEIAAELRVRADRTLAEFPWGEARSSEEL